MNGLNIFEEGGEEIKLLKGFYVYMIDEFFKQEKEKFSIEDFSSLLCDLNFHHNIFFIVCYIFINLLFEKHFSIKKKEKQREKKMQPFQVLRREKRFLVESD